MDYPDGTPALLGDKVKLGEGTGIVVCSINTDHYTSGFPKEAWSYLQRGVLIEFDFFGLIHYEVAEENLAFVSRA